ncbi:odorant receptor 4-like [Aricia agestis]|uniref:odorant receptor 4-like n=1 Tax=Aricia agestis TaxID=91739 RepID=UPI001C201CF4|nr:odorant receptor 4-like [Aricia agestis]
MAEVFTNLRILMLSFVCVVKGNTFLFWHKDWMKVIEYVTSADKYERDTRNEIKDAILDRYTKYCRRITFFYWMLVFATLIGTTTAPYVFLSSPTFREGLKNGTEIFPHVFSSWMPFDKYNFPGNWITVAWHTFMCTIGAGILVSYDTTIIVIMVFFAGKLEILKERCKKLVGDENSIFKASIAELHSVHILLLKYTKLFDSLLSPVMFIYVVMCSLMICMSAIQMAMTTSATHMLIMAEYLVFGIAQLFMICWHSNEVRVKFDEVTSGPYESEWYSSSVQQRKYIILLMDQLKLMHIFTAGPFTNLTIPTFITILKGAYSYYTLLRK